MAVNNDDLTAVEMFGEASPGSAVEGTIPIDPCSNYRQRPRFRRTGSGRPYVIPGTTEKPETELPASYYQEDDMPATAMIPQSAPDVRPVTSDELALIKTTVAVGATDAELKLFLFDCARQGVHPLDRLIHFTKRSGKYTPITSIDFMRIRAAETGEYAGSDAALYAGTDGVWSSLWSLDSPPFAALVTVWRLVQGTRCKFEAVARWNEYKPEQNDFMWRKLPATMLAKCAEAQALRKGFPRQLAGLYAKEEMDQADREPVIQIREASVAGPSAPVVASSPVATRSDLPPSVPNGEASGVPSRDPGEDDDLPRGTVRITAIGAGKGGALAEVTLSSGESYLVWKQATLATVKQCFTAGAAVAVELKKSASGNIRIESVTPVVF